MSPMLHRVAKLYAKKKDQRWYRERSVFVSLRVAQLMARHLKHYGATVKVRNARRLEHGFRFLHHGLLKNAVLDRAKRLVAYMMR